MKNKGNSAGLGKNYYKVAHDYDIAKKQSKTNPGTENLDMNSYRANKNSEKALRANTSANSQINNLHLDAKEYAKEEHDKAHNWEHTATDNDKPTP